MPDDKMIEGLPEEVQKSIRTTTKIGLREHKKLKKEQQKMLRQVADKFVQAVKERVNVHVMMGDADSLNELVTQLEIVSGFQVYRALQQKGLDKELDAFLKRGQKID
jgi:hypothetical protein